MKLLNFGSLNIDRIFSVPYVLRPGETMATADPKMGAGGKGLNQSVAAARAGLLVYHAGNVGTDGLFLIEKLREKGVDTSLVRVDEKTPSGCAYIQVEPNGRNSMFVCPGANHSLTMAQIDETLSHFAPGDMLLLQNETNLTQELIRRGKAAGMKIVFNPSPITEEALAYDYSQVDLLIVNEDEAAAISGITGTPEEMLEALSARCAGIVVLTVGKAGAYGKFDSQIEFTPAFPVEAVDTTGAGDTFTGYLLWALSDGQDLAHAMRTAAKASALTVTRIGAADAIPSRDEVENAKL